MGASDEPDIMTWFPRREDYEDAPVAVMPDETIEEKVDRRVVGTDDNTALHWCLEACSFVQLGFIKCHPRPGDVAISFD